MTFPELPEWSKAKQSDYEALNATKPWPAVERYLSVSELLAWGPFVVEGVRALDGEPVISAFLNYEELNLGGHVIAFGPDGRHSYRVKGRVLPLVDAGGIEFTSAGKFGETIRIRAIRVGDGPLIGLDESASVTQIVKKVIGDDE